jgi:hypothetical protein
MYNLPIVKKVLTNKKVVNILLIIIGAIILFKPPTDPDFGWHYKYGEYIFQNREILKENIFSHTHTDYKWANSYWLSQLIMYTSHHYLGSVYSTLILSFILSSLIVIILNKNSKDSTSISTLFLILVSTITMFVVTARPLYYSTLFMFVLIHTLLNSGKGKKYLPIMFLVWANMHADFVIGLFILGCYSLFGFLERTGFPQTDLKLIFPPWKKKKEFSSYINKVKEYLACTVKNKETLPNIKKYFSTFALSFFATFLNPYGIQLWITLLKELTQPVKSFVAEWAPMGEIGFPYLVVGIIMAMGLLSGATAKKLKPDKYGFWYVFMVIFFYPLSLKSSYFMRIFIIVSSFSILGRISIIKSDIQKIIVEDARKKLRFFLTPFLTILLVSVTPTLVINLGLALDTKLWSSIKNYPYDAVRFIKENDLQGEMMNEYVWGGYLIWQLPEHKTFIDGRMAAWRTDDGYYMEDYRKMYVKTQENPELLEEYIDKYDVGWVLFKPDSNIIKYLKGEKGWKVAYEDDISVILVKN